MGLAAVTRSPWSCYRAVQDPCTQHPDTCRSLARAGEDICCKPRIISMGTQADFPPGIQGEKAALWLCNLSLSPSRAALGQPFCGS